MHTKHKPRIRRGVSSQGIRLLSSLSANGKEIFNMAEAAAASGFKSGKLRKLLHDLHKSKWVERIERGKYIIIPIEAGPKGEYGMHPFLLAGKLISPYYIGFFTALNHYGISEQPNETLFIASTKRRRPMHFQGQEYRFVSVPKKRFFGITEEWVKNTKIRISDKEKTLIDCLFLPKYSKGMTEVVKAFREKLDFDKLYDYALKMENPAVVKRLGFLLDGLKIETPIKDKLLKRVGGGYCLLDTGGPKGGRKDKKWKIIENIPLKELKLEL
ncbi:MAG: type IV toxin-antitoxin system AbiEi family antitoxin [Candidatus Micrarchaeota archaeon]